MFKEMKKASRSMPAGPRPNGQAKELSEHLIGKQHVVTVSTEHLRENRRRIVEEPICATIRGELDGGHLAERYCESLLVDLRTVTINDVLHQKLPLVFHNAYIVIQAGAGNRQHSTVQRVSSTRQWIVVDDRSDSLGICDSQVNAGYRARRHGIRTGDFAVEDFIRLLGGIQGRCDAKKLDSLSGIKS